MFQLGLVDGRQGLEQRGEGRLRARIFCFNHNMGKISNVLYSFGTYLAYSIIKPSTAVHIYV